jgi:hypothetical protein
LIIIPISNNMQQSSWLMLGGGIILVLVLVFLIYLWRNKDERNDDDDDDVDEGHTSTPGNVRFASVTTSVGTTLGFRWEPPVEGAEQGVYEVHYESQLTLPNGKQQAMQRTDLWSAILPTPWMEGEYHIRVRAINQLGAGSWVEASHNLQLVPTDDSFTIGYNMTNHWFVWNQIVLRDLPDARFSYDYTVTLPNGTTESKTIVPDSEQTGEMHVVLPLPITNGTYSISVTPYSQYGRGTTKQKSIQGQAFEVENIDATWQLVPGGSVDQGPYELILDVAIYAPNIGFQTISIWLESPDGETLACANPNANTGKCTQVANRNRCCDARCSSTRRYYVGAKKPDNISACDFITFDAAKKLVPGEDIMVCVKWVNTLTGEIPAWAQGVFKKGVKLPGTTPSGVSGLSWFS